MFSSSYERGGNQRLRIDFSNRVASLARQRRPSTARIIQSTATKQPRKDTTASSSATTQSYRSHNSKVADEDEDDEVIDTKRRWADVKSTSTSTVESFHVGTIDASALHQLWRHVEQLCAFERSCLHLRGRAGAHGLLDDIGQVRERCTCHLVDVLCNMKQVDDDDVACDDDHHPLAFHVARAAFRLIRTAKGSNNVPSRKTITATTAVCRILYSFSKSNAWDDAFRHTHVLDELLALVTYETGRRGEGTDASREQHSVRRGMQAYVTWSFGWEIIVHATAIVKHVSTSQRVQKWMGMQSGAIGVLTKLLTFEIRSNAGPCGPEYSRCVSVRQLAQVFLQVTETLRNMCLHRKHFKQFRSHHTIRAICEIIEHEILQEHAELMYNASRVLSKLSLDAACREKLKKNAQTIISALLRLLYLHPTHPGLVVRVCFVLGNMTTCNDMNRKLVISSTRTTSVIANLFRRYVDRYVGVLRDADEISEEEEEEYAKQNDDVTEVEEALTKIVRVVANVAIDAVAGPELAGATEAKVLIKLFCFLAQRVVSSTITDTKTSPDTASAESHIVSDELLVFVLCALTNLSFWCSRRQEDAHAERVDHVFMSRDRVCKNLVPLVTISQDDELTSEALRLLGNYTRFHDTRRLVAELRGTEMVIIMLDHRCRDVVYASCGVLLNYGSDTDLAHTDAMEINGAVGKLFEILSRAIVEDADIAVVACKALCNMAMNKSRVGRGGETRRFFSTTQCVGMRAILSGDCFEDVARDSEQDLTEFRVVATRLLEVLSPDDEEDDGGDGVGVGSKTDGTNESKSN